MRAIAIVSVLVLSGSAAAQGERQATLEVAPATAKLGDALNATITLELAAGESIDPHGVPTAWGDAEVLSGAWAPAAPGAARRQWKGTIAVYKLGAVTIPPVTIALAGPSGAVTIPTTAATVTIEGVLAPAEKAPAEDGPALADLKPPASIPPDYGPLKKALALLGGLLVLALAAWWLVRRYAARLAAARVPIDPFRKLPPHVWVYEELERLLARRLAEEGKIGVFYDELTRIVKMYLEGRYRIDLLDRTTSEVPPALQQAGAPAEAGRIARALLESGDRVKFAREEAGASACRASVDEAYRLVDLTKPVETAPAAAGAA